jgi:hypothetical protein
VGELQLRPSGDGEEKILYPSHEMNFITQTVRDHFPSSTITPYEQ